jgi:hypothetical protein
VSDGSCAAGIAETTAGAELVDGGGGIGVFAYAAEEERGNVVVEAVLSAEKALLRATDAFLCVAEFLEKIRPADG